MKIHRKLAIAAIIALSITSLTACGGEDKVSDTAAAGLPSVTGNAGEAPTIAAPTGTPPTTLQTQDVIAGTGTEVLATSTLTVHYTLMTWSKGEIVETGSHNQLLDEKGLYYAMWRQQIGERKKS